MRLVLPPWLHEVGLLAELKGELGARGFDANGDSPNGSITFDEAYLSAVELEELPADSFRLTVLANICPAERFAIPDIRLNPARRRRRMQIPRDIGLVD
jgi:hypothetical protein